MDTDLALTAGVVLTALSLPALISAWVDRRLPRLGAAMLLVASGLVLSAMLLRPGGYQLAEVPDVLLGVLARVLN